MDITVIIAIIISTVVALAILALVILLFYYHWRNQELLVNFSAFIRENLKLKDEIERLRVGEQSSGIKLEDANSELADKLDEATGGTRSRPHRQKGPPTVP
jgi:sensor histidine kinase YesM